MSRTTTPTFAWKVVRKETKPEGTVHHIKLTSQLWHGITWEHQLRIYEPAGLGEGDAVLLFITGGSTTSKPSDNDDAQGFALARLCGARCAVLPQVPNQPLLGGKTEDTLISETFVRFLDTKDESWPLLFPMVKSAVRAMDAVQAWAKAEGKARRDPVRRHRRLEARLDHLADRRRRPPGRRDRPHGHRHAQHEGPEQARAGDRGASRASRSATTPAGA